MGGWLALVGVYFLGLRKGREKDNKLIAFAPSNIPFLALGTWILCIGWFGFNVMSAQSMDGISGLVAINSLMAMVGGILAALWFGKNDPGFIHNGPLAGLVAVCAGSDVMHPIGSLFVGIIAGWIFVKLFTVMQQTKKIDDVLGVWPLHGVCGAWGGIAAGIFGLESLGGLGGVSFTAQLIGTLAGITVALLGGIIVYGLVSQFAQIRLSEEEEFKGADLSIHSIGSVNHD
jgi:Amt family ammonium transporter